MKIKLIIGFIVLVVLYVLWLIWGPDRWLVQITGVTGNGQNIQYRIETVYAGTAETLVFRNEDAGFSPPYFKFDSADLQAQASVVARNCPNEPVKIWGYGMRLSWFDKFPNAVHISAPEHCFLAPTTDTPINKD